MKKQQMIKNIIAEAEKTTVAMPWTRGPRRNAWIAKRRAVNAPPRIRAAHG